MKWVDSRAESRLDREWGRQRLNFPIDPFVQRAIIFLGRASSNDPTQMNPAAQEDYALRSF